MFDEDGALTPQPESSPTSGDASGKELSERRGSGMTRLEKLAEKRFTEEKIIGYLADLCEAEDVRLGKYGESRTPNWMAREAGLRHVLNLRGALKKGKDDTPAAPIKIVLNVVTPKTDPPVIDVAEQK